ncbi:MAG: hypothetical protein J3R72DRAFT_427012 [Linnemannia gamsii]|nr:MAG: hypothetical protein J3R72DRAFT_427012 [Linnemannia gamsii]
MNTIKISALLMESYSLKEFSVTRSSPPPQCGEKRSGQQAEISRENGGAKWSSESRLVRDLGFDAAEEAKVVTEELRLTESDLRTINKDITRTTKSICNVKKAVDVSGRVDISNVAGSSGSDEMNDTDVDMEVEEDQRCLLKELRGTLKMQQIHSWNGTQHSCRGSPAIATDVGCTHGRLSAEYRAGRTHCYSG